MRLTPVEALRQLEAATAKWLHMHSLKQGVTMTEAKAGLSELVRSCRQAKLVLERLEEED